MEAQSIKHVHRYLEIKSQQFSTETNVFTAIFKTPWCGLTSCPLWTWPQILLSGPSSGSDTFLTLTPAVPSRSSATINHRYFAFFIFNGSLPSALKFNNTFVIAPFYFFQVSGSPSPCSCESAAPYHFLQQEHFCQIAAWQPSNCALTEMLESVFLTSDEKVILDQISWESVETDAVKTASPAVLKWIKMLAWPIRSKVNETTHGSIPLLPISFTLGWIFKHPYIKSGICCNNNVWGFSLLYLMSALWRRMTPALSKSP